MNLERGLFMNNSITKIFIFILSLACFESQNALAGIVYQWTDEAGNVNFSDVPPTDLTITEIRDISINEHSQDNIDFEKYSIINQAELMAEWRRQITEERLEKKRLLLEEKRLAYEMELNSQNEVVIHQVYIPSHRPYVHPYLPYRYRRYHGYKTGLHRAHVQRRVSQISFGRNIGHRKPNHVSSIGMNSKRF